MKIGRRTILFSALLSAALAAGAWAQSRHNATSTNFDGTILAVTATRDDKKTDPIKVENLYLYENGIEQKIKNFSYDPSPSRLSCWWTIRKRSRQPSKL